MKKNVKNVFIGCQIQVVVRGFVKRWKTKKRRRTMIKFLFLCNKESRCSKSAFCGNSCNHTSNPDHAKNPDSVHIAEEFLKHFEQTGAFTDVHFQEVQKIL